MKTPRTPKREKLYWLRTRRSYGWGYYISVFASPVPCWTAVPGLGTLLNERDGRRAVAALAKRFAITAELEVA